MTDRVPSVEIFPAAVVVAKPPTANDDDAESAVVDALLKMLSAPENVCDARLRRATFDDSAVSLIDAEGRVSAPAERVKPFEAVRSAPKVPVPTVEKAPVLVVVALPLTVSAEETESAVVLALPRVVSPVIFKVDVPVIAPPWNDVPEK